MSQELLLSILVPSIPSRFDMMRKLVAHLEAQIGDLPVEVLVFSDNKRRSIGLKRDALVQMSRATHCAFCDDDDWTSGDYVPRIVAAIREDPAVDVVVFNQRASVNGKEFTVRFGLEHENQQAVINGDEIIWDVNRKPFPCCAWRTALAKKYHFPDSQWGEDWDWVKQLLTEAKTQVRIQEVLHYYRFSDAVTEAK